MSSKSLVPAPVTTGEVEPTWVEKAKHNALEEFFNEIERLPGENDKDYEERVTTSARVQDFILTIGPIAGQLQTAVQKQKGETHEQWEARKLLWKHNAIIYSIASAGSLAGPAFIRAFIEGWRNGSIFLLDGVNTQLDERAMLSYAFDQLNAGNFIPAGIKSYILDACSVMLPIFEEHGYDVAEGIIESLSNNGQVSMSERYKVADAALKAAQNTGAVTSELVQAVAEGLSDSSITANDLAQAIQFTGAAMPLTRYRTGRDVTMVQAKIMDIDLGGQIDGEVIVKFKLNGLDRAAFEQELERTLVGNTGPARKYNARQSTFAYEFVHTAR